jgi:hypothetical protein
MAASTIQRKVRDRQYRRKRLTIRKSILSQPEIKQYTFPWAVTLANNTLSNIDVTSIAQGLTRSTRIGDRVRILQIDYTCVSKTDAGYPSVFLVYPNNAGNAISIGDFEGFEGCQLKKNVGRVLTMPWFPDGARSLTLGYGERVYRPRRPLELVWPDGSTFPNMHRIFLTTVNRTAVNPCDLSGTVRVLFCDV